MWLIQYFSREKTKALGNAPFVSILEKRWAFGPKSFRYGHCLEQNFPEKNENFKLQKLPCHKHVLGLLPQKKTRTIKNRWNIKDGTR